MLLVKLLWKLLQSLEYIILNILFFNVLITPLHLLRGDQKSFYPLKIKRVLTVLHIAEYGTNIFSDEKSLTKIPSPEYNLFDTGGL